jgi:hypothetical protein
LGLFLRGIVLANLKGDLPKTTEQLLLGLWNIELTMVWRRTVGPSLFMGCETTELLLGFAALLGINDANPTRQNALQTLGSPSSLHAVPKFSTNSRSVVDVRLEDVAYCEVVNA